MGEADLIIISVSQHPLIVHVIAKCGHLAVTLHWRHAPPHREAPVEVGRECVSRMAWECLGVPLDEVVTEAKEVWSFLLRLLPSRSDS